MDPERGRSCANPVRGQAVRTQFGRPSSITRLSAWTATPTSVARRWSVRERNPSPITCLSRRDLKRRHLAHRTFRTAAELDQAIHQAIANINQKRSHMHPCRNLPMAA